MKRKFYILLCLLFIIMVSAIFYIFFVNASKFDAYEPNQEYKEEIILPYLKKIFPGSNINIKKSTIIETWDSSLLYLKIEIINKIVNCELMNKTNYKLYIFKKEKWGVYEKNAFYELIGFNIAPTWFRKTMKGLHRFKVYTNSDCNVIIFDEKQKNIYYCYFPVWDKDKSINFTVGK